MKQDVPGEEMMPLDATSPRRSLVVFKAIIAVLIASLLVSGFFLVRSLMSNWVLEYDAKKYAYSAGYTRAREDFVRGKRQLLEMHLYDISDESTGKVPDEGFDEPTGRRDGVFEIRHFLVSRSFPSIHREVQATYIEGYNRNMKILHEKPEWFDSNGFRVSKPVRTTSRGNMETAPGKE